MGKKVEAPEVEVSDTTKAEMIDPNATMVDLDVENPSEPEQQVDDVRAAIYAKHAEKRQEEITGQAATDELPEDEITVKVNGKELKVPREKVDAAGGVVAYQKNAAASELLNQASAEARRVKEEAEALERRRRELDEREQRFTQAQLVTAQKPAPPVSDDAQKALARQYHDAMLDGDIDKADELLLQISAAQKATAVNPDEIASIAVKRAREELTAEERRKQAEKFEAERLEAVAEFPTKYKDLSSNDIARDLVDDQTKRIYREHPDWGAKAIIDEAAKRVRELIKSVAPTTASEKVDAKRNLTQIRAGSARSVNRPPPKPQTGSEYVSSLRHQRGLPT